MDFRQLRYFVEVVDAGSLLAASRKLHISQPALSKRIKDLEGQLGVTLLTRHSRGVAPTDIGRRLLVEARSVMDAFARAETVVKDAAQVQRISIGASSTPRATIIPALLNVYRNKEPACRFDVQDVTRKEVVARLGEADIDVAFCYDVQAHVKLTSHALYSEDLYLIGSKNLLNSSDDLAFSELSRYPLVMDRPDASSREQVFGVAKSKNVQLNVDVEAGPVDVLKAVLMQRRVCTIGVYSLFHEHIAGGDLAARRIVDPPLPMTMHLAVGPSADAKLSAMLLRRCRQIVRKMIKSGELRWRALQ